MGYFGTHKPAGMTTKEFFESEMNFNRNNNDVVSSGKVLDCKTKSNVAYIAFEYIRNGVRTVSGIVCLIRREKGHFNIAYKEMDETMHPFYYDCPKSILDLLTSTDNSNAIKWREKCREQLQKSKNIKIKKGDTVVFENDFRFGGGKTANTFIREHETKSHYWCPSLRITVRLTKSNFLNNKFTVTKAS